MAKKFIDLTIKKVPCHSACRMLVPGMSSLKAQFSPATVAAIKTSIKSGDWYNDGDLILKATEVTLDNK